MLITFEIKRNLSTKQQLGKIAPVSLFGLNLPSPIIGCLERMLNVFYCMML